MKSISENRFLFYAKKIGSVAEAGLQKNVAVLNDRTSKESKAARYIAEGVIAMEEEEIVGKDHGHCSFQRFSITFQGVKGQFSALLILILNRPISQS